MQQKWCLVWYSRFVWKCLVWPVTVIQVSRTEILVILLTFKKQLVRECVFLRLLSYILETWSVSFGKEFVTIFNNSFLSYWAFALSRNSFFMHSRCRATRRSNSNLKSQSVSMKTNMHISSKPVWWDIWSLKLHGNETSSSCDQRFFFSRRSRTSLTRLHREPSVSIRKNPLERRGPSLLI